MHKNHYDDEGASPWTPLTIGKTKRSPTGTAWHPMRTLWVTRPPISLQRTAASCRAGLSSCPARGSSASLRAPLPSPTRNSPRTSPSGITWRFRTCGRWTAMTTLPTPTRVSRSRWTSRSFPPTTPRASTSASSTFPPFLPALARSFASTASRAMASCTSTVSISA